MRAALIVPVPELTVPIPAEVRALPAGWECDLADDTLRWSPGVYDLFGRPRGVPVTRDDVVAQYTPESRAELDRLRAHAIAACGSFTVEAEIRRPDGSTRWIRIIADVVARDGRATHLYGCKQDITAEVRARRAG